MKKLTLTFVLFFLVMLFLVPNVSAFNGRGQVIAGTFQAYTLDWAIPSAVIAKISIVGSANISPSGSLETQNSLPEADQSAINDAFISFAESLNCTVGSPYESYDPMAPPIPGQTTISFVCEGIHRDVLQKTAMLLSFPLTFEANGGP